MYRRLLPLLLATPLSLISHTVFAGVHEIGSFGATITMDDTWQRATLDPDLGSDQFASSRGFFTVILELDGVFERPEDFSAVLADWTSSLDVIPEEGGAKIIFESSNGVGRAIRRLKARFSGMLLAYQLDLLGRDGLGYMVMTWGSGSNEIDVYDWASRSARSLVFPGPESDWGKRAQVTEHRFRLDRWTVTLAFQESLYAVETSESPRRFTMSTADDEVVVHIFLDQMERELEDALERVIEIVDDDQVLTEQSRDDIESATGPGRQAILRDVTVGSEYDLAVAMIPVAENRFLDVRMVSNGTAGHHDLLWRELLSAVRTEAPVEVDAFPEVEVAAESNDTLTAAARALLEASTLMASSEAWPGSIKYLNDDRILAHEGRQVVLLTLGAEDEETVLYENQEWMANQSAARHGEQTLVIDSDNQVHSIVDAELVPLDFTADALASIDGARLLVVRTGEDPELLGFESLANPSPAQLIIRDEQGAESLVTELSRLSLSAVAVRPDGGEAMLLTRTRGIGGLTGEPERAKLVAVDLRSGKTREIGSWVSLQSAAATDHGWLITGAPSQGLNGLYLLTDDGRQELLISGTAAGLELSGNALVYASGLRLADDPEDTSRTVVYRSDLRDVRKHGPGCQPLATVILNRIVERLGREQMPPQSSEAAVRGILAAADAICVELTGTKLPVEPAAIDQLLNIVSYDEDLSDGSLALLTAMISGALLDAGATWLEGEPIPTRRVNDGRASESGFAFAIHPGEVLLSTLFSEDGWWRPVTSILEEAAGRPLLLSYNHEALEQRVSELTPAEVGDTVEQGSRRQIARLLRAHPQNLYLREHVYEYLAATGRIKDLAQLAGTYASSEKGASQLIDLHAWLSARFALESDSSPDQLITDLRQAISRYPNEETFYLLLGKTYERQAKEDHQLYSRACYDKVLELISWGNIADQAEKALEQLDGLDETG
jgi:hypothetical protein